MPQGELYDAELRWSLLLMDIERNEVAGEVEETAIDGEGEGRLESFLFNIRVPVAKYVLRMWLVGFVPSVIIAVMLSATGVLSEESAPDIGGDMHPAFMLFGVIVLSPVIETLAMGVVLKLLSLITVSRYPLAAMSCIAWAGMHSLLSPAWGLGVIWPFFIFSCAYVAWRRRSWWHAVAVTCLIHMLQNLLPGIVLFVEALHEKGW